MNWEEFETTNWDTMNESEQAAWLNKFVLGNDVEAEGNRYSTAGGIPVEFDANLIHECESHLEHQELDLYMDNCLGEASAIAYKDLSAEQIQQPETAKKFYFTLMLLPVEVRGRCIYWAKRGEPA